MKILYNVSKKAISPIIAVILLLLMTVAAAGAAFFWIQSTQRQVQSGVSEEAEEVQRNVDVDLRVLVSEYSTSSNLLQVMITSAGGANVPVSGERSLFTLKYVNGSIVCTTNLTGLTSVPGFANGTALPAALSPGNTSNFTLNLDTGGCTSRLSETPLLKYNFVLDLSGRATVAGSFDIPAA